MAKAYLYWTEVWWDGKWLKFIGFFTREEAVNWQQRVEYVAVPPDVAEEANYIGHPVRVTKELS